MGTTPPPKGSGQFQQQQPELIELLEDDIAEIVEVTEVAEVESKRAPIASPAADEQHAPVSAATSASSPPTASTSAKPLRPMPIEFVTDQAPKPPANSLPTNPPARPNEPEATIESIDPVEPIDFGLAPLLTTQVATKTQPAENRPTSSEQIDLELLELPEQTSNSGDDLLDALAPLPPEQPSQAPISPMLQEIEQAIVNLPQSSEPTWAREPELTATAAVSSVQPERRTWLVAGAGAGAGLLLLLAGAGLWWLLGSEQQPTELSVPEPVPTAVVDATAQSKEINSTSSNNAMVLAPLPEVSPLQVPTAPTLQTIDSIGYWSLRSGCAALQDDIAAEKSTTNGPNAANMARLTLLWWSWYRLATTYQDEQAQQQLITAATGSLPPFKLLPARATAALAGGLLLTKQAELQNKGRSLLKGPVGKTAFGLWVLANFMPPAPTGKTAILQRIVGLEPTLLDARFSRAGHWLQQKVEPEQAAEELLLLAKLAPEDGPIRAALLLYQLGAYRALGSLLKQMPDHPAKESLAPNHYNGFTMLMVRYHLSQGQLRLARSWAKYRYDAANDDVGAAREWAALQPAQTAEQRDNYLLTLVQTSDEGQQAQLQYERITHLLAYKDLERAHSIAQAGAALDQDNNEVHYWHLLQEALLAEQSNNDSLSRSAYQQANKLKPSALLPRAGLAKNLGPEQEKVILLQLLRQGSSSYLHLRLASLWENKGANQEAIDALVAALWEDPALPDVEGLLRHLASLYRANQHYDLALPILLDLAEQQATFPLEQAQSLLQMAEQAKQGVAALKIAQRYVTEQPKDGQGLLLLAKAHLVAQERAQALAVLHQLMKMPGYGQDANTLALSGYAYGSSDPIKARIAFLASLQIRPDATIYAALADLDFGRGKLDDAMLHVQASLQLNPEQPERALQLAKWQLQRGMLKDAAQQLQLMVKHWPNDGRFGQLLGNILREQGESQQAFTVYQAALPYSLGQEKANVLLAMAELQLHDLGHLQQAVGLLRQAIGQQPELAEAHYLLGLALKDIGRTEEGKKHLQLYLKLEPEGVHSKEIKQLWADSGW